LRQAPAAIARSSTYVISRQNASLICELEARQRQAISGAIAEADPAGRLRACLVRFLEAG